MRSGRLVVVRVVVIVTWRALRRGAGLGAAAPEQQIRAQADYQEQQQQSAGRQQHDARKKVAVVAGGRDA